MSNLQVREVVNRSDLKDFIYLPARLHKDHPNWVPPIYSDEWDYYNTRKNPGFRYCDTVIALAFLNSKPAGRIMGIINHRHNDSTAGKVARFSFFDCIHDNQVSGTLLKYVEDWARSKGMNKIIGPFGMYYHDPIGFMTDGFNEKPSTTANFNFEYMVRLLEDSEYGCEEDLVVYKIEIPEVIPDVYNRIRKKVDNRNNLQLVNFSSRGELRRYIHPVLSLMNECFTEIYGYSQLDEDEMKVLAAHFIPLLDPRLVTVVKVEQEVAGFTIAIPSLNEGIISSKGHLFPFGFLKIIKASKKSKQLDLLIGGIKEKYRGTGIDAMISMHIIETAREAGFTTIDSHLELESNWKIRAEMERMGGRIIKKYRIFQKSLV
jgi:hypothetical protein